MLSLIVARLHLLAKPILDYFKNDALFQTTGASKNVGCQFTRAIFFHLLRIYVD